MGELIRERKRVTLNESSNTTPSLFQCRPYPERDARD